MTELLADGTMTFDVDPKFPQAIGVTAVTNHVSVFGNSAWEVLHNDEADSPFFTSDYPVAIETFDLNTPINRVVPLAPDIAIRIQPDIRLSRMPPDLSFAKFKASMHKLTRTEVTDINRTIVQCTEDLVLYRDDRTWIESFVTKNFRYRVEPVTQALKYNGGNMIVTTQRIQARPD
jgi:hypothetical protein